MTTKNFDWRRASIVVTGIILISGIFILKNAKQNKHLQNDSINQQRQESIPITMVSEVIAPTKHVVISNENNVYENKLYGFKFEHSDNEIVVECNLTPLQIHIVKDINIQKNNLAQSVCESHVNSPNILVWDIGSQPNIQNTYPNYQITSKSILLDGKEAVEYTATDTNEENDVPRMIEKVVVYTMVPLKNNVYLELRNIDESHLSTLQFKE